MRCPWCLSPNVSPSRLRWFDVFLLPMLLWPRRCHHCNHRYWRPVFWS